MKKIGFVVQVLALVIALPLLTILEMNHAVVKNEGRKSGKIEVVAANNSSAPDAPAVVKMPA